jgi:hypothetical protein
MKPLRVAVGQHVPEKAQDFTSNLARLNQLAVFLLDDLNPVTSNGQLENRYRTTIYKLRRYWQAHEARIYLCAVGNILIKLGASDAIITTFGLYWDDALDASLVCTDVKLINLRTRTQRRSEVIPK